MKRLLLAASLVAAIGIFFVARNLASWRPQRIEVKRTNRPTFQFSADSRWLLIGDADYQNGTLWDWQEHRLVRHLGFGSYQFSPDGQFLASAAMRVKRVGLPRTFATKVEIMETRSGRAMRTLLDPKARALDAVLDVQWTPDEKKLVVATQSGCRVFEVASGKIIAQWDSKNAVPAHPGTTLSSDGQQIVRILETNSEVRRADNGQFVRALPFGRRNAIVAGFSPDARQIYSIASSGQRIHFWGPKASPRKFELMATVETLDFQRPHFTRTPGVLAFATPNGLELRKTPGGKVVEKLRGPMSEPFALAPDEKSAVSCDARGQIYRWRLR